MKHVIVGTAGHIDHGKTALVKALTGIDTDRLKEEKERGISIELGFAHLDLPGGTHLGIVDVPGHERFVKTMLAGVGGIDLVVLVIAADEGIMPQTREHLHICELLKIRRGLVALTKADLADAEWLEMVQGEVAEFLRGTFLEGAPIIPVSSTTGLGLDGLRGALAALAAEVPPRRTEGVFRLPIDRVFTMRGFGTVVTGTVWSGTVRVGDEVAILPKDLRSRVRRLQVHNTNVETAMAGQRAAVNLPGLEVTEIARGNLLCLPGTLTPASALDATLELLADAPRPLANRARVRFHLGTSEVLARVVLLDRDELAPGESTFGHLRLEAPSAALPRDRYVLRSYSPAVTIGGGTILDPDPPARRRAKPKILETLRVLEQGSPPDQVERLLLNAGLTPLTPAALRTRCDLSPEAMAEALRTLTRAGRAVPLGANGQDGSLHREVYDRLVGQITEFLGEFHAREPLRDGFPKEELRGRLAAGLAAQTFAAVLQRLVEEGRIAVERDKVRLAGHRPRFSTADEGIKAKLEELYRSAGLQPPGQEAALAAAGADRKTALAVFRRMGEDGLLVRIKEDIYLHPEAYQRMKATLRDYLAAHPTISVPTFKDLLGVTRKHAIPFLEHCDEIRLTRRQGDDRVPY